MTTRNVLSLLAIFLATFSSASHGDTYSSRFSYLYDIADQVRLVRIIAVEMQEDAQNDCQFKYRVKTLINFKGDTPDEIYLPYGAYVGSKSLILGKSSPTCANSGIAINMLPFSTIFPLLPYESYLFNYPDEQLWLAFGGSEIVFPDDIRVTDSVGCFTQFERDSVAPCPVPLPAASWADLKKLLERLSGTPSTAETGKRVDDSDADLFGSVYSGGNICSNYIEKMAEPINQKMMGLKNMNAKRQSFVSLKGNPLVGVILDVRSDSVVELIDPQRESHRDYIIDMFSKNLEKMPNFQRARCGFGEGREEVLNSLYFGTNDQRLRSGLQKTHPHWRLERWKFLVSLLAPSLVSEP